MMLLPDDIKDEIEDEEHKERTGKPKMKAVARKSTTPRMPKKDKPKPPLSLSPQ